jgi:hypothetical protein
MIARRSPYRSSQDQLVALSHNLWGRHQSCWSPTRSRSLEHRLSSRVRSRNNWATIDDWSEHLGDAQGKDKRRLLHPVFSPRRARPPAMAAGPTV